MDAFWKWLMQANAKVVLIVAIVALLLVGGWWAWKLSSPVPGQMVTPPSSGAPHDRPREGIGLVAFLDRQATNQPTALPPDPFVYGSQSETPQFSIRWRPQEGGTRPADTGPRNVRPGDTSPRTVVRPKPPPEKIMLTYRGMFKRTDGQTLALIEDSKSKKVSFRKVGEVLAFGAKLDGAAAKEATLTAPDGHKVSLPFNTPVTMTEPTPPAGGAADGGEKKDPPENKDHPDAA